MMLKKSPCLLALALVVALQACKSEPTQLGLNTQPSPQASSQAQPSPTQEVAVAAPAEFKATFTGAMDGRLNIQMTIELVVQDRLGNRSSPVRRALRLYPNRLCGFSY